MNILFVDDEEDLRELAKEIFTDEGFSLLTASNTKSALELFEHLQFDVVITDAHMPQGSGLDFCRTLREKHHFLGKLILVSGEIENDGWKEQFGYDVAIDKPLNFTELIDLIRSL
jgi:DNA-binding response OmpR family regulator